MAAAGGTGEGMGLKHTVFFVICVAVGFSIVSQANGANGMNLFVSKKTLSDLEISIESERANLDSIAKRMEEAGRKIQEYEAIDADAEKSFYGALVAEAALYRSLTAASRVHGPGVSVTLDDSPQEIPAWADANAFIVHDTDILRIISDLSKGGAEAISINGHRIYSGSTIYCNGYTVRINGRPETRPFLIDAIGDPANLSAAMIGPSSYGLMLGEYYGLIFRVQVEEDIVLPAHAGGPEVFRYAQRVQDSAGDAVEPSR
ncbi:MAG: DUF881 domain-containing protein [Clostridiales Family XIII bacterium]|nr:DUF881 domain-containing protein [Clostridiales Family XIII bacterium]